MFNGLSAKPWIALAAFVCTLAQAATLDEVVRLALQTYPSIDAARANRDAAQFGVQQARAQHYPSVDVTSQRRVAGTAINVTNPALRLNLYASGAIEAGVERESWRERSLASTELVTREDVAFTAAQAYFRLFRAVILLDTTMKNFDRHKKLVDDFAAIASIDQGRRYDFVQASSRLEQVRLQVADRETEIAAAREGLARYYPDPIEPKSLSLPPPLPEPGSMMSDDAISRHPSVEAARRLLLSAEANVKAARANRAPRVDLQATGGAYGASIVTFTWPAFDLSRSAAEDAAVASLVGARATLQEQERIIRERQQTSVQSWLAALRREGVAQGQIGLAQEVVDVYRAQFQIGRRNLLDLLNAFAELSNSEIALESARVDKSLARYQLEYAVGRLSALVEERRP